MIQVSTAEAGRDRARLERKLGMNMNVTVAADGAALRIMEGNADVVWLLDNAATSPLTRLPA